MASGNNPAYPPPPAYDAKKEPPPYSPPTGGNPYPPQPGQMPYPQSGQMPPQQPGFVVYPNQAAVSVPGVSVTGQTGGQHGVVSVTTVQTGDTLLVGNCPNCRVGILSDNFSLCGILLAFFFFPIGILCCLLMRERRCNRCGAAFA